MRIEKFLLPEKYSEARLIDLLLSEVQIVLSDMGVTGELYINQGIHIRDTKSFIKLPEAISLYSKASILLLENSLTDTRSSLVMNVSDKERIIMSVGFANKSLNLCRIDTLAYENLGLAQGFDFYRLNDSWTEYNKIYGNYIRWKCNTSLYGHFILNRLSKSENWSSFLKLMKDSLGESWEEHVDDCDEQGINNYIREKEHTLLKHKDSRDYIVSNFKHHGISPILWFGRKLFFSNRN